MKKRAVTLFLATFMLICSFAFPAQAQTNFWLGTNSYSYNGNSYCNCTLSKPGKKDASVKVTLISTGALSVKMTDEKGRYIWGEDYAICPNAYANGARTFKLGKNHSVYRLYFKSTNGKGTGNCSVSKAKNCTIW